LFWRDREEIRRDPSGEHDASSTPRRFQRRFHAGERRKRGPKSFRVARGGDEIDVADELSAPAQASCDFDESGDSRPLHRSNQLPGARPGAMRPVEGGAGSSGRDPSQDLLRAPGAEAADGLEAPVPAGAFESLERVDTESLVEESDFRRTQAGNVQTVSQ